MDDEELSARLAALGSHDDVKQKVRVEGEGRATSPQALGVWALVFPPPAAEAHVAAGRHVADVHARGSR